MKLTEELVREHSFYYYKEETGKSPVECIYYIYDRTGVEDLTHFKCMFFVIGENFKYINYAYSYEFDNYDYTRILTKEEYTRLAAKSILGYGIYSGIVDDIVKAFNTLHEDLK